MYDEIEEIIKNTPYKLRRLGKTFAMHNHSMPRSLMEPEFLYLRDFIIKNNLKKGYEVATAFGISALGCGFGFKETGGRLVSMDAYIEEQFNDCTGYNSNIKTTYLDSDGFKTASFLINYYNLQNTVTLEIGFSPDDTAKVIKKNFGSEKLDFVFIDALHTDEAVLQDALSVKPFLDSRNIVFFHDLHCFSQETKKKLSEMFDGELIVIPRFAYPNGEGYTLAYISKL